MRNAYKILVDEPKGKRPLGRPRRRWEDNIKMNHRKVTLSFSCSLLFEIVRFELPDINSSERVKDVHSPPVW
jgi:hypothetical protein